MWESTVVCWFFCNQTLAYSVHGIISSVCCIINFLEIAIISFFSCQLVKEGIPSVHVLVWVYSLVKKCWPDVHCTLTTHQTLIFSQYNSTCWIVLGFLSFHIFRFHILTWQQIRGIFVTEWAWTVFQNGVSWHWYN
jgi:hypothetical protein